MTLVIKDQEHFDKVSKFAKEYAEGKLDNNFHGRLEYLRTYSCPEEDPDRTQCLLFKDFAPYSFAFSMQVKDRETGEYKYWFNGGLIFHGPHDNGGDGGAPTFSVNLTGEHGWSIHT